MSDEAIGRREFIGFIVSAAAALPSVARTEFAKTANYRLPKSEHAVAGSERIAAFEDELKALGWIPGRTVAINIDGSTEKLNVSGKSLKPAT